MSSSSSYAFASASGRVASALAEQNESQARRVRVTCEYIDRMLVDVERVLALAGVHAPTEELIPASRAAHVALGTAGISAEELKPRYMRG
jgi:hypothetical protein